MAADDAQRGDPGAGAFRQEILDAIAELLRNHTVSELRIADILKAAKVSRGTFYFYYASKEDAFAALLDQVYARLIPAFERLFADPAARSAATVREGITEWVSFSETDTGILRSALEEWPRHVGLREVHLAAQARLAGAMRRALEADRKAGLAPAGVASATLASALAWTLERAWYEALVDPDPAHDVAAVGRALAATIGSALYGRD